MAIEEDKIKDLIEAYEGYQEECESVHGEYALGRAGLYRTVINDLKKLLPRKSLADLDIDDYGELTGTIVEHRGRRGVILGGDAEIVTVFTITNRCVRQSDPKLVFPQDGERVWDENGVLLY